MHKTFLWYLKRPVMYPELARLVLRKVKRMLLHRDDVAEERAHAKEWCEKRAISAGEAIEQITGKRPYSQLRTRFGDVFTQAEAVEESCPVKMGGPGDLDLLYELAEFTKAERVIETGVAYGWSSLALLLSLVTRNGMLVSTDLPYPGMDNDPYVGCVVPESLRKNWKLLRGADRQRIPEALRLAVTLDLCHYDSDKSYGGRMFTYPRLWGAIRSGGIFISDDIGDNMGFAHFAESSGITPFIIKSDEKYIGVLLKP